MIVLMFAPQFAPLVEAGTKIQTIRPPRKRPVRIGDTVSLRAWTGKPYRSKQRVLGEGIIQSASKVELYAACPYIDGRLFGLSFDDFAYMDGFRDWAEMRDWFQQQHGLPFHGVLIQWRKL